MNKGLDVRAAIRDANGVFGHFPARICLPLVSLCLLSTLVGEWIRPDKPSLENLLSYLVGLIVILFISFWLNCYVGVVVSSMYLRAREGEEPGAKQLREALQYRGFASVAGGLFLRYLGWGGLLGLVFGVLLLFAGIFSNIAKGGGSTSRIGATAGGVGHVFDIIIGVIVVVGFILIATRIFCRYMFIFPMFAIVRGGDRGFLDECTARTEEVWKTAAVVLFTGAIPGSLIIGIERLTWKYLTPPHGVHVVIQLIGAVLIGCYTTWFILVKTGLAMQLLAAPAVAIEPAGGGVVI
jgi:hypothetical protein